MLFHIHNREPKRYVYTVTDLGNKISFEDPFISYYLLSQNYRLFLLIPNFSVLEFDQGE